MLRATRLLAVALGMTAASLAAPIAHAGPVGSAQTSRPASSLPISATSSLAASYNDTTDVAFRRGLQIRLAWAGDYVGGFDGTIDVATLRAIRDFQARHALTADGVISDGMLRQLITTSDDARNSLGAASVDDGVTGARVLIPNALVANQGLTEVGNVWRSEDGSVEVETVRLAGTGQTLRGLFEVLNQPTADRRIENSQYGGSWFTLDGRLDDRVYFMRFAGRGDDLRGYTISFTKDRAADLGNFVAVASNMFEPFAGEPSQGLVASADTPSLSQIISRGVGSTGTSRYASAYTDPNNPHLFEMPQSAGDDRGTAGAVTPAFDMAGSGFMVSKDGWVLTNSHVVKACHTVMVGGEKAADDIVFDPENDLALLKIKPSKVEPLKISSAKPRLGEDVLALGYPLRSILADSLNVTRGNVSSLLGLMNDPRYLQISAPVQPGNSGGPLVDLAGRVVGVVTAKLNAVAVADATGDIPQAINFAIRPDAVTGFLQANGVAFVSADPDKALESVPEATEDVKDAVLPIICTDE